jgi:TRAP-type C4-dicarboxylate transport system permease large subunit
VLNGGLGWRGLREAIEETAVASAMIFFIILGAGAYNTFLAFTQLPMEVAEWVGAGGYSPYTVLALILFIYIVLGCFMDSLSMILLTIPIFLPIVTVLDFGLPPDEFAIWFGILVLVVVEMGLITPPVGMNLFVINSVAGNVPMAATFRGVLPFVASDIVRIALLVLFPSLTLFLVRLL